MLNVHETATDLPQYLMFRIKKLNLRLHMLSKVEALVNKKAYVENCLPEQYAQIPTDGIKS